MYQIGREERSASILSEIKIIAGQRLGVLANADASAGSIPVLAADHLSPMIKKTRYISI